MNTILVVENEDDILFALTILLERDGYAVRTAQNGAVALETLEKHGLPDLILLDMSMPIMDGWEFSRVLDEKYKNKPPVVIMTAAADAGKRAKDIGAADWIGKPFVLKNLLELIKKTLSSAVPAPQS